MPKFTLKQTSAEVQNILDSVKTKQNQLISGSNIKTINNNSILGSGNINILDKNSHTHANKQLLDNVSLYLSTIGSTPSMISNPISVSELSDKTVVFFGDSITQGTSLGDPTTEGTTTNNSIYGEQKYPAITNEELENSIPKGSRGKSFPYYIQQLGFNIKTINFGTSGWCLPTGRYVAKQGLSSKIDGRKEDGTVTSTVCIETLKSKDLITAPYAFFAMFGVNEFTRGYPLGQMSNLKDKDVLKKISTYKLTYITYEPHTDMVASTGQPCYRSGIIENGDRKIVGQYDESNQTWTGIHVTTIDELTKTIYVDTDTMYGAWEYMGLRLLKDYPQTKIVFMTPPVFRQSYNGSTIEQNTATKPYSFKEYCNAIIKVALSYKIPVLDNYYLSGINLNNAYMYIGDGCHLNYRGGIHIAKQIIDFLQLNPMVLETKWLKPGYFPFNNEVVDDIKPQPPTEGGQNPDISVPEGYVRNDITGSGIKNIIKVRDKENELLSTDSRYPVINQTLYGLECSLKEQNTYTYLDIPLYTGSEIHIEMTNTTGNATFGFEEDPINSTEKWWYNNTTSNPTGPFIPTTHLWRNDKQLSYLYRNPSSGLVFRNIIPKLEYDLSSVSGNNILILKVIESGMQLIVDNKVVYEVSKNKSNPYITHSKNPVYFTCSGSQNYSIRISKIIQYMPENIGNIALTGVKILPPTVQMQVGNTQQMELVFTPATATNKKVSWIPSKEGVVSIDEINKTIIGIMPGSTVLSVLSEDGGHQDTCDVTILPKKTETLLTPTEINNKLIEFRNTTDNLDDLIKTPLSSSSVGSDSVVVDFARQSKAVVFNQPLKVGDRVEFTVLLSDSNENIACGLTNNIATSVLASQRWKENSKSILLPNSHFWMSGSPSPIQSLNYKDGTFRPITPQISSTNLINGTPITLEVIDKGFILYQNNNIIGRITKNNNCYDESTAPAYFMLSSWSNAVISINKIWIYE